MKTALFFVFITLVVAYNMWPKTEYELAERAYLDAKKQVQMLKEQIARQKLKF